MGREDLDAGTFDLWRRDSAGRWRAEARGLWTAAVHADRVVGFAARAFAGSGAHRSVSVSRRMVVGRHAVYGDDAPADRSEGVGDFGVATGTVADTGDRDGPTTFPDHRLEADATDRLLASIRPRTAKVFPTTGTASVPATANRRLPIAHRELIAKMPMPRMSPWAGRHNARVSPRESLVEMIRRPSVTPDDGGALDWAGALLEKRGYRVDRIDREGVKNLYAARGDGPARLCLAGHVDTVPVGEGWTVDPYAGLTRDGFIWGRGASDMKSGVAGLLHAALTTERDGVSVLLTSDEEGPAQYGTLAVLQALQEQERLPKAALVAEPTSETVLGDAFKIGRRGSVSIVVEVAGTQGHVAYPEKADNAAHRLAEPLARLVATRWDDGDADFPPTSMQIYEIASGGIAANVVPGSARVGMNFRYGPSSTVESLHAKVLSLFEGLNVSTTVTEGAEPFRTESPELIAALKRACEIETGMSPRPSTLGGTSDARFFAAFGIPVVEFGAVPVGMHGADERVAEDAPDLLARTFSRLIEELIRRDA